VAFNLHFFVKCKNFKKDIKGHYMKEATLFLGKTPFLCGTKTIEGEVVERFGGKFYKISNFDKMPPFLMNIVSDSDIWMFIASNGALTAGRKNPDNALFPYYTDDRIYDSADITGSKTILRVQRGQKSFLWEPFSNKFEGIYNYLRYIYKNIVGNQLVFEEINYDLGLSFVYTWTSCEKLGIVKKSIITNLDANSVKISLLDGMQNILPPGISRRFQNEYSNLADGYKRNELVEGTTVALYTLSSLPTDKAEPNESLRANTVWSTGLDAATILLSDTQLRKFRCGNAVQKENETKGQRGAYFLCSEFVLQGNEHKKWCFVADLNQDHTGVSQLLQLLQSESNLYLLVEKEVDRSREQLKKLIAAADGFQSTADAANDFRHFSNTTFNILRGGIPAKGYWVDTSDFRRYLNQANKPLVVRYADKLNKLPETLHFQDLLEMGNDNDPDFAKLCLEYLPLTFGRRHGDPSRPWNSFSIETRDEHGNQIYNYQGNWRDIFQNWEALAISFPLFIESMIAKFVNASSADGYNPYRVLKDGFEWEELDPHDEWSNIGYWGDHQIIYLLKLLELSAKYHPGKLQGWLSKPLFSYANIPYRIKPYDELIKDPHNTIEFDDELNQIIIRKVKEVGSSAKLVPDPNGGIYYVNLTEKLLLPLLVKLSNFVPEAGIWMNTQRPEWNDANNALVGYGASMVTLYYIRRYLTFCIDLFDATNNAQYEISTIVKKLFDDIAKGLEENKNILEGPATEQQRKAVLDKLGWAGSNYRQALYHNGFNGQQSKISATQIIDMMRLALQYVDHSIRSNQREDHLYHSYNLIRFTDSNGIAIRHMYEMLEGQVAILSSGYLKGAEALTLLKSLRRSALYREDQHSYMLYPNRELPGFLRKNKIPAAMVEKSRLLTSLLAAGDRRIIQKDAFGEYHFHSDMANGRVLKAALKALKPEFPELVNEELQLILDIYEAVFDHQSFTGRSGTFYKYEGLGSIYWHMVSKLLLAVQENFYWSRNRNESSTIQEALKSVYYDIREGIGVHKSPKEYGAFPVDAYSHTPLNSGAQQPGMTGQVKEDILSRFGELGVTVRNGQIFFDPALLQVDEFVKKTKTFEFYDIAANKQQLPLQQDMLGFTLCQVPFLYKRGKTSQIVVHFSDGQKQTLDGLQLPEDLSTSLFKRENKILRIETTFSVNLCND
jgi:hypothetical protein